MSKFSTEADEQVYEWTLDGTYETAGRVDYRGWAAFVPFAGERQPNGTRRHAKAAILREDEQGFVDVDYFDSLSVAIAAWAELADTLEDGMGEDW